MDSEKSLTVQTDSDDNAWFSVPARVLLGSDPGLALHVLTGVSESSGYRYANGSRAVPGYIIRQLLRSPHGWQWLAAIMDGCKEPWWVETKYGRRAVAALKEVPRED